MRRTPIKKIGKKGREWQRERRKRVAELKKTGEYNIQGNNVRGSCLDCEKYRLLTPDHKIRRSKGGKHSKENIDWICVECHDRRDNQQDPMGKKPKSKKADWSKDHKCKNKSCRQIVSILVCPNCGKISI